MLGYYITLHLYHTRTIQSYRAGQVCSELIYKYKIY